MNKINHIIRQAKANDSDAYEVLLELHRKMIYKIINTIDRNIGDFLIDENDLYQEASLALLDAARQFEEDREVKFSTFAYIHMRNHLLNYVKSYRRSYRDDIYSFDCENNHLKLQVCDSSSDIYRDSQFRKELEAFMAALSEEERKIFLLKGADYSYKEIAKRLNVSTKKVDNKLTKLKSMIRKSKIDEYLFR